MSVLVIAVLLFCFSFVVSDTLEVPGEYPNIQAAINASSEGDTVLVYPGTYEEQISFLGKNIVVRSANGPSTTRIYSVLFGPTVVFFINGEDSTAVLEGFTISNTGKDGISENTTQYPQYGGGIYIEGSSPTIRNNVIICCVSDVGGGGAYCLNSSPFFEGNTIEACLTDIGGGVLCVWDYGTDHTIRFIGNSIIDNTSMEYGGGLCVVTNGPGNRGSVELIGNTITGNNDRGIYLDDVDSISVIGNLIFENTGDYGGGIYIDSSNHAYLLSNVSCANNSPHGAGAFISSTTTHMENCTISGNTNSGTPGPISFGSDTLTIHNSIIWSNSYLSGPNASIWLYDTFLTLSYTDIEWGQDSIFIADTLSVINWGSGNIDVDPLFETGPLSNYHLSVNSPCIDAGNPTPEYNDPEDPFNPGYALWPAMGYIRNDMGAYGGQGVGYVLSVEEQENPSPSILLLSSYPNPFSSSCVVAFTVSEASDINLGVFDLSGRQVQTLFDGFHQAGNSSAWFDGSGLPSGVYVVVFRTPGQTTSQRCVLIR